MKISFGAASDDGAMHAVIAADLFRDASSKAQATEFSMLSGLFGACKTFFFCYRPTLTLEIFCFRTFERRRIQKTRVPRVRI